MRSIFKYLSLVILAFMISSNDSFAQTAEDWYILGNDMYAKKDYQGAIDSYNKAIQLDPKHANAFSRRGNAKQKLQDLTGAAADFTQSISINPKNWEPW